MNLIIAGGSLFEKSKKGNALVRKITSAPIKAAIIACSSESEEFFETVSIISLVVSIEFSFFCFS